MAHKSPSWGRSLDSLLPPLGHFLVLVLFVVSFLRRVSPSSSMLVVWSLFIYCTLIPCHLLVPYPSCSCLTFLLLHQICFIMLVLLLRLPLDSRLTCYPPLPPSTDDHLLRTLHTLIHLLTLTVRLLYKAFPLSYPWSLFNYCNFRCWLSIY